MGKTTEKPFDLEKNFFQDVNWLTQVDVPVVTVSASFKEYLHQTSGEDLKNKVDVVFSRAHYSMARGLLEEAYREGLLSWMVDPTNYVSEKGLKKVIFTEKIGKIVARNTILKKLKDLADTLIRSKLPIAEAITPPLLELTKGLKKPIISLHYETGNALARTGTHVVQVITDPHVRPNYLEEAERGNIVFCVFDEKTKEEFFEVGRSVGKKISNKKVIVTGPPIDPRITDARKLKTNLPVKPLRLVITTSGLGTNKDEIKKLLESLLPFFKQTNIELLLYAGTHYDFFKLFTDNLKKYGLQNDPIRIIYDENIVKANEMLIKYGFPWAHGFVTKPSGDMAYDALASGCFILSLTPWGEWEENIEKRFMEKKVLQRADSNNFLTQLNELENKGWIASALKIAAVKNALIINGSRNIINVQQSFGEHET